MASRGHAVDCAIVSSSRTPVDNRLYHGVRCIRVYHHPLAGGLLSRQGHRLRRRLAARRPGGLHFCPPGYLRMLEAEFPLERYSLCVTVGASLGAVTNLVRCPTLCDMHELFTHKAMLLSRHGIPLASPYENLEEELECLAHFDALWCPSTQIRETLARLLPETRLLDRHISIAGLLPEGVPPASSEPAPGARILFAGSTALENRPGLYLFLREILPRIRASNSAVEFHVVGWRREDLPDCANTHGVVLHGRLPDRGDVLRLFASAHVVVIPRFLGGLTIKGVEALALGKATVGHPLAFSGCYEIRSWEHAVIASDSDEFAAAVLRLLAEPDLARRLGASAARFARTTFDPDRVYAEALELAGAPVESTTASSA